MIAPVYDGKALNTAFCLGKIAEIAEPKLSEKGNVSVQVDLEPVGTGKKIRFWLVFLQGVFGKKYKAEGFGQTKSFAENVCRHLAKDKYNGFDPTFSMYGQYVGLAKLHGICGSAEKWAEVSGALQDAFEAEGNEYTDEFLSTLHDILQDLVGTNVGYILKQQIIDSDEINEKGRFVKVPGNFYELAGFFFPDEKTIEKINDAIETFNKETHDRRAVKLFDESIPFDTFGATED